MQEGEDDRPDQRRRRRLVLLAVLAAAMAWTVATAVSIASSMADLRAGRDALRRVRGSTEVAEVLKGSQEGDLRRARSRLGDADRRLSGVLLMPARPLPFVGRQIRSVQTLARAGSRLAGVGADGLAEVRTLLDRNAAAPEDRVALVRDVGRLAATTRLRLDDVDLGPRQGLLPALARAHNQLADEYDEVREGLARAASGAEALSGFLGGPRRYLVFAANNAEMRAGAGMFLSVGTIESNKGQLTLGSFQTVFDVTVPPGSVPLEGDLAARWGWLNPNNDWRNLMLSPRFDASASLAAQMWEAVGNPPVDGVVALDPVALEQLLGVLGPITVDDLTIDAEHVVDELINAQYRRFPLLEERPERREALGRIASATFSLLDQGRWSLPDVAEAIADSVRGRHLMAWSAHALEQDGWRAAGVDGTLGPESLLVSVLNRGGNKLDRYLNVTADLACAPTAEDDTECALRLDLANVTPEDEPQYIAGPHPGSGVNAGDYLGIVSVNLPGAAAESRIDGVEQLAVAGADGPSRVIGYQLVIPRNEQRQVVVRFRLPGRTGAIEIEPSARVPGIRWSSGGKNWGDGSSRTVRW